MDLSLYYNKPDDTMSIKQEKQEAFKKALADTYADAKWPASITDQIWYKATLAADGVVINTESYYIEYCDFARDVWDAACLYIKKDR